MVRTSNDPSRWSPEAILREAREARSRAITDGLRRLWRTLTHGSRPVSSHPVVESVGAAR